MRRVGPTSEVPVQDMPYQPAELNRRDPPRFNVDLGSQDGRTINVQLANVAPGRTWGEWIGDRAQAGLGAAVEQLAAGILLGIGQIFIQEIGNRISGTNSPNVANGGNDVEAEGLKLAACTGDCQSLLGEDGKAREAVLKMLAQANKSEPQNYSAYLLGVVKCIEERNAERKK